ncbi:hypothetical protein VCRA2113O118_200096 [Vibrio crassostreae]|nr:hypothetical protein VCRA2114E123_160121 [Vibrio crassostreae]CAK1816904.1 hypothetical protein VCRA2114E122_170121 [Vibrio crassostreae]CAK2427933.1 hypothetical protein VCRA2114E121_180012 [Vibrio crassostreae]CAK2703099.1 hypothetical protein VCRA2113O116_180096 [Vibrio crassostreae]CAK2756545.1 hypothetical protein VCRA217O111_190096 [Vibrio crassostreae]
MHTFINSLNLINNNTISSTWLGETNDNCQIYARSNELPVYKARFSIRKYIYLLCSKPIT